MHLIVGLGNPGDKYSRNRHNIGFLAVEEIARRNGFPPFKEKFKGLIAEGTIGGELRGCAVIDAAQALHQAGQGRRRIRREVDRIVGLEMGADDYLAKPFNTEELVARVESLLRRAGKHEEPSVQTAKDVKLDRESRKAFVKNKEVPLSAKEFDLLWNLMYRKNRVLTRDFLLQHVWGYDSGLDLTTKVVDVTLSHLRDKLGPAAEMIVAVRGFGYRFDDKP